MSRPHASHRAPASAGLALCGCLCALLGACDAAQFSQDSDTVATSHATPTTVSGDDSAVAGGAAGSDDSAAVGGGGAGGDVAPEAGNDHAGAAGAPEPPPIVTPQTGTTNVAANGGGQAGAPASVTDKPVLFWLEIMGNRVWRADADGTNKQMVVAGQGISTPDGITIDAANSYLYWTNMGTPLGGANLGSVQRLKLGTTMVETVVPVGLSNTPNQIALDAQHSMLYWCDRDAAKVWRSKLNGTSPEVLVSGHNVFQPSGIALDVDKRQFYFSDRIGRRIYRASFDLPAGQNDANRTDVEELFSFSTNALPLDLALDVEQRKIYWTDRARGTVQRASMDLPTGMGQTTLDRADIEVLASSLPDPVGIALDLVQKALYFTELDGDVWRANLDGSNRTMVVSTGSASGVQIVRMH